jgi:hypothetical protein
MAATGGCETTTRYLGLRMRSLRLLITTLLAFTALATFAPAALGAGATTETFRDSFQLIDDHGDEAYIFDIDAVSHLTTRPDGTMSVSYNLKQVQTHTVLGVVADVIVSNTAQHSLYLGDEQTFVSHSSGHHRYSAGDESCQTTIVWQVVDDELVIQNFKSVCP